MEHQAKLTAQLREGNYQVIFDLMSIWYKDFYSYALHVTGSCEFTKDLVQQFILHMWHGRENLRQANSVESYVFVSFKRFLQQKIQKSKVPNVLHEFNFLSEISQEDILIFRQQNKLLRELILEVIAALPERQQQLIGMRFFEQKSFDEIARETSLSVRTVYNTLSETLKKLRNHERLKRFYISNLN